MKGIYAFIVGAVILLIAGITAVLSTVKITLTLDVWSISGVMAFSAIFMYRVRRKEFSNQD
ncbi:MAG: hypothetical protein HQL03_00380 [Nitrospirae bacterium]|nr:hypothetical protein [Nitrospirota bacterium]MBF0592092.1 hypothetical protein [Nitrospirota bacterium]